MGMYDNLGEIQVKCFPVYWWSRKARGPYGMGGNLRYFGEGEAVPWATQWYCYGKNFLIFDYRFSDGPFFDDAVSVIKDGKFCKNFATKDPELDNQDYSLVLDNYGTVLRIKNRSDFANICHDAEETNKQFNEQYAKMDLECKEKFGIKPEEDIFAAIKNVNDNDTMHQIFKFRMDKINEINEQYREPFAQRWTDPEKTKELDWMDDIGCAYEMMQKDTSEEMLNEIKEYFQRQKRDFDKEYKCYQEYLETHKDDLYKSD